MIHRVMTAVADFVDAVAIVYCCCCYCRKALKGLVVYSLVGMLCYWCCCFEVGLVVVVVAVVVI